jgi:hypothetical protein
MVVDAVIHEHDYEGLEPELLADWRAHYGLVFAQFKPAAIQALRRGQGPETAARGPEAVAELAELERSLAAD